MNSSKLTIPSPSSSIPGKICKIQCAKIFEGCHMESRYPGPNNPWSRVPLALGMRPVTFLIIEFKIMFENVSKVSTNTNLTQILNNFGDAGSKVFWEFLISFHMPWLTLQQPVYGVIMGYRFGEFTISSSMPRRHCQLYTNKVPNIKAPA